MQLSKDTVKKIMFLIVFTIVVAVVLFHFDMVISVFHFLLKVVSPFIIGIVLAFILNLPMKFYERVLFPDKAKENYKIIKKTARPISLLLSVLSVLGVIILVVFVVVPQLYESVVGLGQTIQDFLPELEAWIMSMFPENQSLLDLMTEVDFKWDTIINQVINFLKNGAGNMLNSTFVFAKGLISTVTNVFVGFILALYILLQKEKLRVQMEMVMKAFLSDKIYNRIQEICSLTYKTFSSFITGQCVEAVILGCIFLVVLGILQYPYALLISVLIGFTALVPLVGAFIGCAVGTFLILMISPVKALIFIVMFLVIQQLEGNLIYPHVVGNSIGLPSIWVLVAVSLGGSLMGILGMLLFIPLVSVIYTLFRNYVYCRLKIRNTDES